MVADLLTDHGFEPAGDLAFVLPATGSIAVPDHIEITTR